MNAELPGLFHPGGIPADPVQLDVALDQGGVVFQEALAPVTALLEGMRQAAIGAFQAGIDPPAQVQGCQSGLFQPAVAAGISQAREEQAVPGGDDLVV